MSQAANARGGYSPNTLSFKFPQGAVAERFTITESTPVTVVCIDGALVPDKVPDGFIGMGELRARRSRVASRQAAVEVARQKIGSFLGLDATSSLKGFRLAHGLSQHEFAERLGTTQPYVSRVEKHPGNAGVDFMRRLCAAFGIDMNQANELLR